MRMNYRKKDGYIGMIKESKKFLHNIDVIEFDMTTSCTRKCTFCAPGIPVGRREKRIFLDHKQHVDILKQIVLIDRDYHRKIVYCGHGEPTLHPQLGLFLQNTKKIVKNSKIMLSTNGDTFDKQLCLNIRDFVDVVVFDNYDDRVGKRVLEYAIQYNILDKIRCKDHVGTKIGYSSRAGSVFTPNKIRYDNCFCPQRKLFCAAEGYWLLCCQDYAQTVKFKDIKLIDFLTDHRWNRIISMLSKKRGDVNPCKKCEIRMPKHPRQHIGDNWPRIDTINRLFLP